MRASTRRSAAGTLLAAALGLAAAGCGDGALDHPMLEQRRAMSRPPVVSMAMPVPGLRLPTMAGDSADLREVAGEGVTVVNVWATWCVPCRDEMPELVRLQDERGGEALRVVGIAVDSEEDGIRAWMEHFGMGFPVLHGMSRADMERAFRSFGVPRTYVVTRDTIRLAMIGSRTLEQLEAAVDSVRRGRTGVRRGQPSPAAARKVPVSGTRFQKRSQGAVWPPGSGSV